MVRFNKGEVICRDDIGYPEGALVCVGYDVEGRLVVYPLGGGFEMTIPAPEQLRFRAIGEAEQTRRLFRRAEFTLVDAEEVFEGWTDGRAWNGWAMPAFEQAEARRLLKSLGDRRARFDAAQDAFVTMSQDGDEELWAGEMVVITDGTSIKVYAIGAGAWTWEALRSAERPQMEGGRE